MAKKKKDILDDEEYEEEYDDEYEDDYDDDDYDDDDWEEDERNRRKLIIAIAAVLIAIIIMLFLIFFPKKPKAADEAVTTPTPEASAEVTASAETEKTAEPTASATAAATAEATPKSTPASSVGTVSGVNITSNSAYMTVTWNAAAGASGYTVGVNSNGNFTTYDTTGNSVQVPTSALSDGSVAVTIIARDSQGNEGSPYNTSYAYRFEQDPLPTPTGFSSYQDGSQIIITWNAVPDAAYYSIMTGYGSDTVYEPKYALDMSSATESANFSITVYAYPSEDDFRYSASEPGSYSLSYSAPELDVPTGVSAVMTGSDLTITWNDVSGESGYTITVNGPDGAAVSSAQAGSDASAATFYGIASKLTSGSTYTVYVTANGGNGMSSSAPASASFTY